MPAADNSQGTATLRLQTARLVGTVRWAAAAIGAAEAVLSTSPQPVGGPWGVLGACLAMVAYNLPVALLGQVPARRRQLVVALALAGDIAVVTTWTMLTANDEFSTTYAAFSLVAIEAASLYGWRGTCVFLGGFTAAQAALYALRWEAFGFGLEPGSVVYRFAVVVLVAVFTGGIAAQSEERRLRLVTAGRRYARLHRRAQWQSQRHAQLLESVSDVGEGIVITEAGRLVHCNGAYRELTGYSDDELKALPSLIDLAPEEQRAELAERLRDRLGGRPVPFTYESQLVARDGHVVDVETAVRRLTAEGSRRIIAVVRDVTERRRAQAALQDSERRAWIAARTDPLTGVANRRGWEEELAAAMEAASRSREPLSVAILDLDGFKAFNDDWGHQRGDEQLRAFTAGWRAALRTDDRLARLGGDEFGVILPGVAGQAARAVIERLRLEMTSQQTFSVGIATWDGRESGDTMLSRADAVLYDSKRGSGGHVVGVASTASLADWSARVRDIIDRGGIDAAYQPIRRLDDRSILGYEALARPSGARARDSVEELFKAAKRLGRTRDLDWLCRRAAVEGHSMPPGTLLFVNVSVHALLDPHHEVDQMELLLRWAGRRPQDVVLEISERDPVADLRRLERVLAQYREAGFRFAIDDIGEGHSTLEVLACSMPEFVKVARSLTVGALLPGPGAAVRGLVRFCESSGSSLIAEGLESELHVRLMRDLGVDLGQGYALGAPEMPDAGFVPRLVEPVA